MLHVQVACNDAGKSVNELWVSLSPALQAAWRNWARVCACTCVSVCASGWLCAAAIAHTPRVPRKQTATAGSTLRLTACPPLCLASLWLPLLHLFILLFFLLHTLSIIMKSWVPNQLRSLLAHCPSSRRDTHVPRSPSLSLSSPHSPSRLSFYELHFGHSIGNRSNRTHTHTLGNRLSRLFINKREAANEESTKYAGKFSAVC